MTLSLTNFIQSLTTFGNSLVHSATRLSHVGDGASVLLPSNVSLSRYTNVPTGDNLTTVNTTLSGSNITQNNVGINAQVDAAVDALRLVDLTNVDTVEDIEQQLLLVSNSSVAQIVTNYVQAIQSTAPYDAVGILFSLANSVVDTSEPPVGANYVRNSLLQMLPTNIPAGWSLQYTPTDITVSSLGYFVDTSGIPYVRLNIAGNPTSAGWFVIQPDQTIQNLMPGNQCTMSAYIRINAAQIGNPVCNFNSNIYDPTPEFVEFTPTTSLTQYSKTFIVLQYTNTPPSVVYFICFSYGIGAVNYTVDVGLPTYTVQSTFAATLQTDVSPYVTLLRVNILTALAQSIVGYTTSTSDEAQSLISQYVALHDSTIAPCSDYGWTQTVQTLNTLRASVLQYLQNQLAQQPRVYTKTFNHSVPDVVACYSIYGNLNQLDKIVTMNNPTNPLQMPTTIEYPALNIEY